MEFIKLVADQKDSEEKVEVHLVTLADEEYEDSAREVFEHWGESTILTK